jgi:hypothetical protein
MILNTCEINDVFGTLVTKEHSWRDYDFDGNHPDVASPSGCPSMLADNDIGNAYCTRYVHIPVVHVSIRQCCPCRLLSTPISGAARRTQ